MAYRDIIVNGKSYKYTIGKTDTKIVGVGVFWNDRIGNQRSSDTYEVTPKVIAGIISNYQKLEAVGAVEPNDPRLIP